MTITSSPSSRNAANAENMPKHQPSSNERWYTFISPGCNNNFLPSVKLIIKRDKEPSLGQLSSQRTESKLLTMPVLVEFVLSYGNTDSWRLRPTLPWQLEQ